MNHAADNEALASCFRRIFDDDDMWVKLLSDGTLIIDGACSPTWEEAEAIRRLAADRGRNLVHD